PDDADTTSHLWRLARVIGKYRDADRTPLPEPPPAAIQDATAIAEANAMAGRATGPRPTIPRRIQTEPLADTDLTPATLAVGDATQPHDVGEIEIAEQKRPGNPFVSENSTMALSPQDLRNMIVPPRPPPRPPQIRPPRPTPPPAPRKAQAVVRRAPLPTLPSRSFESPWEELAV